MSRPLSRKHGSAPGFFLRFDSINLLNAKLDIADLIEAINEIGEVGLVVVDTLARSMIGGDESSTRDMVGLGR